MISRHKIRVIAHHVFKAIYMLAVYVYRVLRFLFRPLFHAHPRIYRFATALREAGKELIRPPEIIPPPIFPDPVRVIFPEETTPGDKGEVLSPESEQKPPVPSWLRDEWREIHAIEPQLFPEQWLTENIPSYHIPPTRIAEPYLELCRLYGDDVSHVFLVPWLVRGGADLVTLNYVRLLTEEHLAGHIVVIATLNTDSPWQERLPENIRFIEFGKMYDFLSPEEQERLFIKLLLQMGPQVIHNINSDLGYRVFAKYGKTLVTVSKLYASSFCFDYTEEGRTVGYGVWYLAKCFEFLEAILSDNHAHLEKLREIYAFDKQKMYVNYQPAPPVSTRRKYDETDLNKTPLDILWAGRLDRQKRPDILIELAKKCENLPFKFYVYGSSLLDMDIYTRAFEESGNIIYCGAFNGLPSLPVEQYDVFLYTSQWDGLPNVLLESTALGLPIIASDVGGISELIRHGDTGFLVDPYDDADRYVLCLQEIYNNRSLLASIAGNAYQLISSRHSWNAFGENVRHIPHYTYR